MTSEQVLLLERMCRDACAHWAHDPLECGDCTVAECLCPDGQAAAAVRRLYRLLVKEIVPAPALVCATDQAGA